MNENRRNFLKKAFTATILTAACPHIVLGKIEPDVVMESGSYIIKYPIDIATKFTDLQTIWKSVYFSVKQVDYDDSYLWLIIARLDKEETGVDFSVVNQFCPHEGQQVYLLHEETHEFVCSGHGTVFDKFGNWISGLAEQDLLKYQYEWDGGDVMYVVVTYTGVPDENTPIRFLTKVSPNPCSDNAVIEYGTEYPANVVINIVSLDGSFIKTLKNSAHESGAYSLKFNVSDLPAGTYFINMLCNGKQYKSQKFVIGR